MTVLVVFIGIWEFYKRNDIDYQLAMLDQWTTNQRIEAMSSLSDKNKISIIPTLIQNIDNEESASWRKDPKWWRKSLSCVATFELEYLTHASFGTTCNYEEDYWKDSEKIIQKWRDWYKNEYPAWLEEQNKKHEKT